MPIQTYKLIQALLTTSLCFLIISCSCSNTAGLKGNGDLIAPEVESISPSKFKTKVPLNNFVSATFTEEMDTTTILNSTFYLKDSNNNLIGTELIARNKSVTLKPYSSLGEFTLYTVTVERGIRDSNGNRLAQDFRWSFTTGNEYDREPPEVEAVFPGDNETAVSTGTLITVSFSEAIDISSVDTQSFRVENSDGTQIPGTFTLSGRHLIFTPNAELEFNTDYLITLTDSIQDLAANALISSFVSGFTTNAAPDTVGPDVVNIHPAHDSINVATNNSISVTFSEALGTAALETDNFLLTHSNGQVVNGTISNKDNILIFTPTTDLITSTLYSVTLKQAIDDKSGNTLTSDFNWQFTTGDGSDLTPATVSYVQPEIDAENVANNNSIAVTFSEPIDPQTLGQTKFTVIANGDYVAGKITYFGSTAIFNPNSTLTNNTLHEVSIAAGVSDLAGNLTTEAFTWKFTTGTAIDSDIPRVSSVYPIHHANDFSVNSAVIVRFTEAMNPATLTPESFYLVDSLGNTVESTIVTTGASSTLRPLNNLNFSETYTVNITTNAGDLAENFLLETYSWSFTTTSEEDTTSPSIVSTAPSSGSQKAAVNHGIIISFSEAVSAESISPSNFYLTDTSGNIIPGIISTTEETAIYKPTEDLDYTKTYTVNVLNTITDMANNPLNKTYSWNFTTTSQPDSIAPTVIFTSPMENGLSAANQNLIIQFSEPMNTSSLTNSTVLLTDLNGNFIDIVVSAAEKNALISPITDLEFDTSYRVTVTTNVKDLANNSLASNFTLNFKTSLHPDLAPPFIISSQPYDQQENVHITTLPTLTFSESINCLLIASGDLQLLDNQADVSGSINCSGDTLTFEPDQVLNTQTTYTIVANTSITDLAGDTLQSTFQSSFKTAPWTQQTGTVFSDQAFSVSTDNSDNIITAGFTIGSFGGLNQGSSDIFVTKHDKNSSLLWVNQFGSSSDEFVTATTTDASNNIYLIGYTYGDLAGSSNGNSDIFVIKLNSDGDILWQQQIGTAEDDAANAITLDNDGNIIIAAYSFDDFNGHTNNGKHDIVVLKLDGDGNTLWDEQYGSTENDIPNAVTVDSANNIVLTGNTLGNLQSNTNQGDADIFVSQLSTDGTHLWTQTIGSFFTESAQSVAVDSSDNILITGFTLGELSGQTNAGNADHFVAKLDSTGTLAWLKQFGTTLDDKAYGLALNSDDTLIITGYTLGDMQGTNAGKFDIVTYKLDTTGVVDWTTQLGSDQDDVSFTITLDSAENIYLSGYTAGSIDDLSNLGQQDSFLIKLDSSGTKQ